MAKKKGSTGVEPCDLNSGPWVTSPRGGGGPPEGAPIGGTSPFLRLLCPPGGNRGSDLLASPLTPMSRKMGLPGPCSGRSKLVAGGGLGQDLRESDRGRQQ